MENNIEKIAEQEHNQWIAWSKELVKSETAISLERRARWQKLWKPYAELTDAEKEQDRYWARKLLPILKELRTSLISELIKEMPEKMSGETNQSLGLSGDLTDVVRYEDGYNAYRSQVLAILNKYK